MLCMNKADILIKIGHSAEINILLAKAILISDILEWIPSTVLFITFNLLILPTCRFTEKVS